MILSTFIDTRHKKKRSTRKSNNLCTFNNPLKDCFLIFFEISYYNLNSPDTNCNKYISYKKKRFSNGFIKIIRAQNQLPITFCSDLVYNKALKARNSTHTHTRISNL